MEKNKVMMIVIIVLLLALLITIVGVFFYTLRLINASNTANQQMGGTLVQEIPKLTVEQIGKIDLSSAIRTDLSDSENGEEHLVQLNVTIGFNNTDKKLSPTIQKLIEENDAMNKDLVLSILRSKTYEDLKQGNGEGFEILKDEVLTKLRETYESNLIYSVYFSDIVLQ